jgi:hypothetical protein
MHESNDETGRRTMLQCAGFPAHFVSDRELPTLDP